MAAAPRRTVALPNLCPRPPADRPPRTPQVDLSLPSIPSPPANACSSSRTALSESLGRRSKPIGGGMVAPMDGFCQGPPRAASPPRAGAFHDRAPWEGRGDRSTPRAPTAGACPAVSRDTAAASLCEVAPKRITQAPLLPQSYVPVVITSLQVSRSPARDPRSRNSARRVALGHGRSLTHPTLARPG